MRVHIRLIGGPHDGVEDFDIHASKKNPPKFIYLGRLPSPRPSWSKTASELHPCEYELKTWYDDGAGVYEFRKDTR